MINRGGTYYPNGTGRDKYIFANNGGLLKVKKILNQNIVPSLMIGKEERKYEGVSPKLKKVRYQLDGSGRDSYARDGQIKCSNQNQKNFNFLNSLRSNDSTTYFRASCQSFQRSNSGSPFRRKRILFQEQQDYQIPNFEFSENNISPQDKERKTQFQSLINSIQKRIVNTIEFTNDYDKNTNLDQPSTIKAAQFPDVEKISYKSPKRPNVIIVNSLPKLSSTKEFHQMLLQRKIL